MSSFWNGLKQRRQYRKEFWDCYGFYCGEVLTDEFERRMARTAVERNRLLTYSKWI